MNLEGQSIIGSRRGQGDELVGQSINPATGAGLEPAYVAASPDELDQAAQLAAQAFDVYRHVPGTRKAAFLRAIAEHIEASLEALVERTPLETGLPEMRVRGETARTCAQLRMFADLVEEGSWVDARIELAKPDREPLPKPDLRSMQRPLGPVAVFAASNFPLAFSTAGGDTASALAAGCPVIVKAHSSHSGTSEIVGLAIQKAVRECGLPEGVFSLVYGSGRSTGQALVNHPAIKAVGFTGSFAGGRALMDLAASRETPIPVYAEMSAVNPVVILPGAARERGDQISQGLYASMTLGVGQFCTNPGLVFVQEDDAGTIAGAVAELVSAGTGATMLNAGICAAYGSGLEALESHPSVTTVARAALGEGSNQAVAALFRTTADAFLEHPELKAEVFGPATIVVSYRDDTELAKLFDDLEGQLTASVHGAGEDLSSRQPLLQLMEDRAGRLVFNGFPTGVEVCTAMVHGGPYPATSDGRSTSVGTMAIHRFTRPVSWQDCPDPQLPEELKSSNPLGIQRKEVH